MSKLIHWLLTALIPAMALTLVNSLRVWSGDGQRIDVPVWRDDLPCPKHWRGEEDN